MKPSPQDIPIEETIRFLTQWLPVSPARVLDVGCGTGVIAAELILRGYILQAIDSDPVDVGAARGRSVSAEVATWPAFTPDNPIAIVFIRALHHVDSLNGALDRCKAVLPPGGVVLVEDFAFPELPDSARTWLRAWAHRAAAAGLLRSDPHRFVLETLHNEALSQEQDRAHPTAHHATHSATAIEAALRQRFRLSFSGTAPYFYRYMAESILDTPAGHAFIKGMLQAEETSVSGGRLWPLGRRWVAVM
jgi:ubiquinone/menaquinone biosynthesis C-methylase UbiE